MKDENKTKEQLVDELAELRATGADRAGTSGVRIGALSRS